MRPDAPCRLRPAAGASARRLLTTAALSLLLGACGMAPTRTPPPASETPVLPLQTPASLGRSLQAEQQLGAAYGRRSSTLRCLVSVDPTSIDVIAVTAMGQRVFRLRYDGTTLDAERSVFAPEQIDPAHILADLQLAFWPTDVIAGAAADVGMQLQTPRTGLRRLLDGDYIVAEVHDTDDDPWNGRLWLVNLRNDYTLDITTTVAAEAAP